MLFFRLKLEILHFSEYQITKIDKLSYRRCSRYSKYPPSRGLRPMEMPLNSQKKIGYIRKCYFFASKCIHQILLSTKSQKYISVASLM